MEPVADEKAPEYAEGFSYDDYCNLVKAGFSYKDYCKLLKIGFSYELWCEVAKGYTSVVESHNTLLERDGVSKNLIEKLKLDIKNMSMKLENMKKSKEEFEDANAKLKVKTNMQEKQINRLNSVVNRLEKGRIQSDQNYEEKLRDEKADNANLRIKIESGAKESLEANKRCGELKNQLAKAKDSLKLKTEDNKKLQSEVKVLKEKIIELEKKSEIELYDHLSVKIHSLETKLKQQGEFTSTADVQSYMDQLSKVNDKIISDLKIQHGLEKDVIRIDLKNKAKAFLELQKEVQNLKEANRLLEGIVRSVLEEERMILKNASRKGPQVEHLKYFTPDLQEFLKKIAVQNEKRRNGEDLDDDVECGDNKASGAASTSK